MGNGTAIDATKRNDRIAHAECDHFDVAVIGAGITGCGIARETAMRGMRTLLVDADDIGSGTSSRSSKLIHGGLRYLAQGQMTVVREAARERRILRRIAPHLSLTNIMVVLAHSKKSINVLRTGMWTYETMGGVDSGERHRLWTPEEVNAKEPAVRWDAFAGAIVYPEYLTDDARLTLANARSAAGCGAVVINYMAVTDVLFENGAVSGLVLQNTAGDDAQRVRIRARKVVNAAGPWVDAVRKFEDPDAEDKLQLTKGIHLVVSRTRLPLHHTVVWAAADGRGLFAVPRGRFVYIGTTDTFFSIPVYWPEITRDDVGYLLESTNRTFAVDPLRDADILALWSGIRPLLGAKGKKPSEISRRNEILKGPGGMLTIAGGKLTSYRAMAQRTADQIEKDLGRSVSPSRTGEEPLPGGDFTEPFENLKARVAKLGLPEDEAERAANLYGTEALDLFSNGTGPAVEAEFAVKTEGALLLEDYWIRRSARSYFDENCGFGALIPASRKMGELLNWSEAFRSKQVNACKHKKDATFSVIQCE
ncbi:MAG: glycerol-3-phosphate dehydrogenase/oxidase [Desulfobacterales bacterium]